MTKLYGSVEAGGTKFVCAVGDESFQIVEKTQFPTTTPYETIERTEASRTVSNTVNVLNTTEGFNDFFCNFSISHLQKSP